MFANLIGHHFTLLQLMPGISLGFSIEPLGLVFALVATVLWCITMVYSYGYMHANQEKHLRRFYTCLVLALVATLGIAFSENLLTMFLCYEALTLTTYPLVTHHGKHKDKVAGRVYLGYLLGSSIGFFLVGIFLVYQWAGNLTFQPGGVFLYPMTPMMIASLLFFFVFGVGKAAVMPMHRWLPAAMVAPTPVSAVLHAVAVVKAGAFVLIKIIVYIIGYHHLIDTRSAFWWSSGWVIVIAGFTIIAASLVALYSDNLKRRLAYSTISQLSYIVMACALGTPKALLAAGFHIAAHGVSKITLFFAAGSWYTNGKIESVKELKGIASAMPWTTGAFVLGALAMIGLPPTAGFITKWYLIQGMGEGNGIDWFVVGVIVISTLLNIGYFLPIIIDAYTGDKRRDLKEAPLSMVVAMVLSSLLIVALWLVPQTILGLLQQLPLPGGFE